MCKLSGNRRRPYIVKKTVGWNDKGHPIYEIIGYTTTREEGMMLLSDYNRNPWDVDLAKITLEGLFELWQEKKAPKLGASNKKQLIYAFKHIDKLADAPYKSIKSFQMQETIDNCGKGYSTQSAVKKLWGHLDKFALEMDIITRCYSDLLTSAPIEESNKQPFTDKEVNKVWEHKDEPWADSVLVLLYAGWRITELLMLKKTDVDLNAGTMRGGIKTKAGKGRIVPIHSKIRPFIEQRMTEPGEYLFSFEGEQCTDYTYRNYLWHPLMDAWGMEHTPHECRHTFRTRLDAAGANQKCCDMLMGHVSKDTGNRTYNHKTIDELKTAIELITK